MNNKFIQLPPGDLVTRQAAIKYRLRISALSDVDIRIIVDLGSVTSISESFADEIFGVLVLDNGADWLLERIALVNASDAVTRPIAKAVVRRSAERGEATLERYLATN